MPDLKKSTQLAFCTGHPYTPDVISDGVTGSIHGILRARNRSVELRPELALGAGGLDLDSIALVEVLLECEAVFGVDIAAKMLNESTLTVGSLVKRIQALVGP